MINTIMAVVSVLWALFFLNKESSALLLGLFVTPKHHGKSLPIVPNKENYLNAVLRKSLHSYRS